MSLQVVDQYGNDVAANGVSLTLSNSGSGFFDTKSGVTTGTGYGGGATATLTLTTSATGQVTAYFGDDTTQSDTITVTGPGISATTPPFSV